MFCCVVSLRIFTRSLCFYSPYGLVKNTAQLVKILGDTTQQDV